MWGVDASLRLSWFLLLWRIFEQEVLDERNFTLHFIHYGVNLSDLWVGFPEDLWVIHELHLNLVGSGRSELIECSIEDVFASHVECCETIFSLNLMNAFLIQYLFKEAVDQVYIHELGGLVWASDNQLLDRIVLIDLSEALWCQLCLIGVTVINKLTFNCMIKDQLSDFIHNAKLLL